MRISLFIGFILLQGLIQCKAQSPIYVEVYDSVTLEPIENVHIIYLGKISYTNDRGLSELKNYQYGEISFKHISYQDTTIALPKNTSAPYQFFLKRRTQLLKSAEVNSKPYEIFAPETSNVFDFEWIHDSLLVLTYQKEQMVRKVGLQSHSLYLGCQLFLVSPFGSILDSLPLPDYIQSFYRDPLNQVFILSDSEVYFIQIIQGRLYVQKTDSKNFEEKIKPLNGESMTNYFFDNYIRDYPEFSHFSLSKESKNQKIIRTISNPFTMELFRAEYKYMSNYDKLRAIRLEQQIGIDKEIIAAYMCGFPQSPYYHPVYAPLFSFGDSVYIFDTESNTIFLHSGQGQPIDSIDYEFIKTGKGKFTQRIIRDRENPEFFAIYKRSGIRFLRKIFIDTGQTGAPIRLYYTYPENIKAFQNKVYYLYRRTGSDKTKHLYAERIE